MTGWPRLLLPANVTLSRSEGSAGAGQRDASLRLSMTGWPRLLHYHHLRAFRLSSPQRMVMGKFLS